MNRSLEYQMYCCLLSYPCRCTKKWEKGELKVIQECRRCALCKRYEEEVLDLERQS